MKLHHWNPIFIPSLPLSLILRVGRENFPSKYSFKIEERESTAASQDDLGLRNEMRIH